MISIIIPYYNRPVKLIRCINSIKNQTYKNIEIIVIDDCSNIAPNKLDTEIKYFRNEINLGPGKSRNLGLEIASGRFVAFLDCDDYWNPTFLEKTLAIFEKHANISMVYANSYNIDADENILGLRRKKIFKETKILPTILQKGKPWGTGSCLWKASKIKPLRFITHNTWEDYAFHVDAAIACNSISFTEEVLVYLDSSGDDKLSNKNRERGILEKAKSLIYVTERITTSSFKNDNETKKALQLHLLASLIKLKTGKIDKEKKATLKELQLSIKKTFTPFTYYSIIFVNTMPEKIRTALLYRIKKYIK